MTKEEVEVGLEKHRDNSKFWAHADLISRTIDALECYPTNHLDISVRNKMMLHLANEDLLAVKELLLERKVNELVSMRVDLESSLSSGF